MPFACLDAPRLIPPPVAEKVREILAGFPGCEVFLRGVMDGEKLGQVEMVASGNVDSAPAIIDCARAGDVVIHNHPDETTLVPSAADVSLAAIFGNNGVGFWIIDDAVTRVRVVVGHWVGEKEQPLDYGRVRDFFAVPGPLASHFANYEKRDGQAAMARTVAQAFNQHGIALIEAGTGLGKGLAYLAPVAQWLENNSGKVVVSTHTKNLQQQLFRQDIPLLSQARGKDLEAVVIMGQGNYLCRRNLESQHSSPELWPADEPDQLSVIREWGSRTATGNFEELSFLPTDDLLERLRVSLDTCTHLHCRFYDLCFYWKVRKRASQVPVIIVNHSLLMADLAMRRALDKYNASSLLPAYDHLVVDECHHLEDEICRYFGKQATRKGLLRTLTQIYQAEKGQARGCLPLVQKAYSAAPTGFKNPEKIDAILADLGPGVQRLRKQADLAFKGLIFELLTADDDSVVASRQWRLRPGAIPPALQHWMETEGGPLSQDLKNLGEQLQSLLRELGDGPEDAPGENPLDLARRELQSKLNRLTQWLENFLTALNPKAEDTVYWVEAVQRQGKLVFCAEPVNGGPLLAEMLFDPLRTVVCTSATITVDGSFDFFLERCGLAAPDAGRRERTVTQLLSSPFRYDEQLALVLLSQVPEPGAAPYRTAVAAACREALEITAGRTFILCTSWDQVRFLGEALREYCAGRGYTLFLQGALPRERLLGLFRADISSVLIGTDSFWEGVDVPGESLSQVIITRLPFKVPTEPLEQARVEWLQKQGQAPFMQYSLPRAVIKFRQGFGRLIRTDRDRGLVTVLDQRILTKPYGRVFLASLPGGRQFCGENVLAQAAAWWKAKNRKPLAD